MSGSKVRSHGGHSQSWPLQRREFTASCTPRLTLRRTPQAVGTCVENKPARAASIFIAPESGYVAGASRGITWFHVPHVQTCRPCIPADRTSGRSSVAVHTWRPCDR